MVSRAWTFGLVLAVPLVAFGVADATQAPRLMSTGALAAAGAGVFLLALIRFAGAAARGNRSLLLYLFRPGLYLTALALIGLVIVHAALAMAAIFYGESALVHRIHVGVIAAIGLGAMGGVWSIAANTFSLVRRARTWVMGTSLSRADAPDLWTLVDGLAARVGALQPQNLVVGLDPNFFVTEASVVCLNGTLAGRTLYCSLPLSRILSVDEVSAVIGHELGHFKGLDTKFSKRFYPIYRGTTASIGALRSAEGTASIALMPAIAILSYFLECFSVAESLVSRDRELAADREGVGITSPAILAAALVKVHAFSGLWEVLQNAAAKAVREGRAFINASKTYADTVAANAKSGALRGLDKIHLNHPTDTHPPLGVRLAALGVTVTDVSKPALSVTPSDSAISLVPTPEKIEEELSDAYHAILARQLGVDRNAKAHGE